jgi:uncharacterized damage-inducible protein DinB
MKDYITSLAEYNTWANIKISGLIEAAGEERATMLQKSSFPTIKQTLLHILDAQFIWDQRLHGNSIADWPGKNFNGTASEAGDLLIKSSHNLEKYVQGLTEKDLKQIIAYRNIKGEPFKNPVWEILVHLINHGTYHRGQLVTMLRGSGFTAVTSTDMINYFRERQADPANL